MLTCMSVANKPTYPTNSSFRRTVTTNLPLEHVRHDPSEAALCYRRKHRTKENIPPLLEWNEQWEEAWIRKPACN